MLIDLDGAVKTIMATQLAGVKRFVMISSFDTTREAIQAASSSFGPYVVARHNADEKLRATDSDYTIIHPGVLANDTVKATVDALPTVERHEYPREDDAHVILTCLEEVSTIGKEFQVVTRQKQIKDAIKAL